MELALFSPVLYPIESHINSPGSLLFPNIIGDIGSSKIVRHHAHRWLRMSHFVKYRPYQHLAYNLGYAPKPNTIYPTDEIGFMLIEAVSNQNYIGWGHCLRGRLSPVWGQIQGMYYHDLYSDGSDRPKSHNTIAFQSSLAHAMWLIFQGIWKQCNTILHNTITGSKIKQMDERLRKLYFTPSDYVSNDDLFLFQVYDLNESIQLSPYAKEKWLETIYLLLSLVMTPYLVSMPRLQIVSTITSNHFQVLLRPNFQPNRPYYC